MSEADGIALGFPASHCPQCAYPLQGLPGAGNCPECGNPFDSREELVLYGWAAGSKARRHNSYDSPSVRKQLITVAAASSSLLVYVIASGFVRGRFNWESALPWTLIYVGTAAYTLYRLWRAPELPAPVCFRAGPRGYVQRDGVGPADWNPWVCTDHVKLTPFKPGLQVLCIERAKPTSLLAFDNVEFLARVDAVAAPKVLAHLLEIQRRACASPSHATIAPPE